MQLNTHLGINPTLCGVPEALGEGTATVTLATTEAMAADARGLVHGGFVFGLADYAAMLAVNDPNVVLGSAETRFTAPVAVGQSVTATATQTAVKGRKHTVVVVASVGEKVVFSGTFTAFVLDGHVLDG
ncbi:MAG: acyl-coenzyme A thioesterase PaaI-like protein [Myxococcota bacterium]|jgi:acyl-coenzyme A thioesterase PaaI-like protein